MKISFEVRSNVNVVNYDVEYVERKGKGHPDTLADTIAETASQIYSSYCISKFGRVAHHWFDKVMLIGGSSDIDYGRGELLKPYRVIFAGKVTNKVGEIHIPVQLLLEQAVDAVLSESLTGFISPSHRLIINELVDYQGAGRKRSRYQPASELDLANYNVAEKLVSNDCNLISAYAPLSALEEAVKFLELTINSKDFKDDFDYVGWDVKVFGVRNGDKICLTANIPFLAGKVVSHEHYLYLKCAVVEALVRAVGQRFAGAHIILEVNPQDRNGEPYLTALGSAADTGDVGVVGRGNRINGLITPMRSMSIEAPCGKNPIDHTGKIFGKLCVNLAEELYRELNMAVEVHIYTLKGDSLTEPHDVLVLTEMPISDKRVVNLIVEKHISNVKDVIESFVTSVQTMC